MDTSQPKAEKRRPSRQARPGATHTGRWLLNIIVIDGIIKKISYDRRMKLRKLKLNFSTTHMIMISFLLGIFIGSILLSLPVSTADGKAVPYIDALFTATTSICVTGLVTLPTYSTWSVFGQIVILVMIQIGGLGIVTILSGILISFNRKFGLKDRILMQDAFNLNSLSGIVRFLKKVFKGTFLMEGIGALLYMTVFVPEFGWKGIWYSVFNAISAFCNAGMDIISENSLCPYAVDPVVNLTTSLMVISGGIGYVVWWDMVAAVRNFRKKKFRSFAAMSLHSKIALTATAVLLVAGAAGFFIFEYNNPLTIGNMSLPDKIQVSFFQSMTTRTAGFASVPQGDLTNTSALFALFLMFIGGSPVGTAGGVKTVTMAVLVFSALAEIRGKEDFSLFRRRIPRQAISKAVAVITVSFMIMFISTILLSAVTNADLIDIAYETVSATATVGLTRDLTPTLDIPGKIIIIVTMYLGRVGPISLLIAFNTNKKNHNIIKDPEEKISIG